MAIVHMDILELANNNSVRYLDYCFKNNIRTLIKYKKTEKHC